MRDEITQLEKDKNPLMTSVGGILFVEKRVFDIQQAKITELEGRILLFEAHEECLQRHVTENIDGRIKITNITSRIKKLEEELNLKDVAIGASVKMRQDRDNRIINLKSRIKELKETIKFGTVSNERLAEEETEVHFLQSQLKTYEDALEEARLDFTKVRGLISLLQTYPMNEKVSDAWNKANACVAKYYREKIQ